MVAGSLKNWKGFPSSSAGKEFACNAGNPSSIPGSRRSPGEQIGYSLQCSWASLVAQLVKNQSVGDSPVGDLSSIPESGRSSGEGNGNPLQYSCLESSTDRGAWWATVHRVAKSGTQLKWLNTHIYDIYTYTVCIYLYIRCGSVCVHVFIDINTVLGAFQVTQW